MARKPEEFNNHPASFPETTYRAVCKHVVDGDTVDVMIDLGLNKYAYETVRIKDIDTPEIFRSKDADEKQAGMAARDRVKELILDQPVMITTYKDKASFGRFLADVAYMDQETGEWTSLANTLNNEGHAKE